MSPGVYLFVKGYGNKRSKHLFFCSPMDASPFSNGLVFFLKGRFYHSLSCFQHYKCVIDKTIVLVN